MRERDPVPCPEFSGLALWPPRGAYVLHVLEHGAMARFFHADRNGALVTGQALDLRRLDHLTPQQRIPDLALQTHAEDLFPDGLSNHGMGYLFWQNVASFPLVAGFYDAPTLETMRSHCMDLVWEFVRRAAFETRPSRYESVFCWGSRDDASRFLAAIGGPPAAIWEVEGDETFRADMNLLTMGTALETSHFAHRYWRGETRANVAPLWECFLAPGAVVTQTA